MKVANRPGVKRLIVVGGVVAALGLFSIVLPYVAETAVAILVGAALLVAGIGEIVQSFSHETVARKLVSAASAATAATRSTDPSSPSPAP